MLRFGLRAAFHPFMAMLMLSVGVSVSLAGEPGMVRTEFLFETAPFAQCHASTIEQTTDGQLVAAWFGGTREKHPDVGIWVTRQTGDSWTPPVEVANGVQYRQPDGTVHRHPCWNPVLFQPASGPLMLFYKCGPTPQTWWGLLTTSEDGGKTWQEPRRLPEGILGPVKNRPVQLADGSILCPSSTESEERPSRWAVHFERTADLGRTWERIGPVNDGVEIQAIQPSILKAGKTSLLAIGRSRQNRLFETASTDGGRTWGPLTLGRLPNPNSGTDATTLADGRHLIVYNHVPGDPAKWGGKRTPLNVAVSTDGREWQAALVLEDEPGEYSYPAVMQAEDGLVHITWTWQRKRVRHAVIDPAKLVLKPMVDGQWPR